MIKWRLAEDVACPVEDMKKSDCSFNEGSGDGLRENKTKQRRWRRKAVGICRERERAKSRGTLLIHKTLRRKLSVGFRFLVASQISALNPEPHIGWRNHGRQGFNLFLNVVAGRCFGL